MLLQQKDLENSTLDLQKLERLKEAEVQNERRSAEYWKDRVRKIGFICLFGWLVELSIYMSRLF